jgi:Tfp pilus assembly protein FimV
MDEKEEHRASLEADLDAAHSELEMMEAKQQNRHELQALVEQKDKQLQELQQSLVINHYHIHHYHRRHPFCRFVQFISEMDMMI